MFLCCQSQTPPADEPLEVGLVLGESLGEDLYKASEGSSVMGVPHKLHDAGITHIDASENAKAPSQPPQEIKVEAMIEPKGLLELQEEKAVQPKSSRATVMVTSSKARPLERCIGQPIAGLLEANAKALAELRIALTDTMTPADIPEDSVLLRYLLYKSNSKDQVAEAAESARRGVDFRNQYAKLFHKVAMGETLDHAEKVEKHLCVGRVECSTLEVVKPAVFVIRSGMSDPKGCMNECTQDEVVEWLLFHRVKEWKELQALQNETGRFMLVVNVNDFNGVSLLKSREPRFFKALGEASKVGADMFPVVSSRNVMINTPWMMKALFSLAKPLMPKEALDKIGLCPAADSSKDDLSKCPYCKMMGIEKGDLPDFLGGSRSFVKSSSSQ